jgi:5-methylthioadenosine/S-adenosylhomocysteine deaminase
MIASDGSIDLLITDVTIVDPGADSAIQPGMSISVHDGLILSVNQPGDNPTEPPATRIIKASGKYLVPGLINAHTHLFQILLRGLGDELSPSQWYQDMMLPAGVALTADDCRIAAALGCAEALLGGVTTVMDFMQINTSPELSEAVILGMRAAGVRTVFGRGLIAEGRQRGLPDCLIEPVDEFLVQCMYLNDKFADSRRLVNIWLAPYVEWALSDEAARRIATWLDDHPFPVTIHASDSVGQVQDNLRRYGTSDLTWLAQRGLLRNNTLVVHAVQVDTNDIELIAKAGSSVAHCPVANLYGGSGIAPIAKMRDAGIKVALGSDGSASNNSQDMLETIKFATLLQKGHSGRHDSLSALEALALGTSEGAEAIDLGNCIGRIRPGYRADFSLINLDHPHTMPLNNPISQLVYAATPSNVEMVIVDGQVVVDHGKLLTLDIDALMEEAQSRADALVRRAGLERHRTRSRGKSRK